MKSNVHREAIWARIKSAMKEENYTPDTQGQLEGINCVRHNVKPWTVSGSVSAKGAWASELQKPSRKLLLSHDHLSM